MKTHQKAGWIKNKSFHASPFTVLSEEATYERYKKYMCGPEELFLNDEWDFGLEKDIEKFDFRNGHLYFVDHDVRGILSWAFFERNKIVYWVDAQCNSDVARIIKK